MIEIKVEDILLHGNIDPDDEESIRLIESIYLPGAIEYLNNAGITGKSTDTVLFKLCVCMLALHWFEDRAPFGRSFGVKGPQEIPRNVQYLIYQLQLGDEPFEEATDDYVIEEERPVVDDYIHETIPIDSGVNDDDTSQSG